MNYRELRNKVMDDLYRTDITAQAQDAIKAAVRYYERKDWWFNEERATAATVADQEFYALPSDFIDEHSLLITVNGHTYPLLKRHYSDIENWRTNDSYSGQPTDYGIYDEQFRVYPIPDESYTLTLAYTKRLEELSAETDENAWTNTAAELIRSRAGSRVAAQYLHDTELASVLGTLEKDEFYSLNQESMRRQSAGKLRRFNWKTRGRG